MMMSAHEKLLAELHDLNTSDDRRRAIGEALVADGDSRPGIGINASGLPDIDWVFIAGAHRIDTLQLTRYSGPHEETSEREETVNIPAFFIARYPITVSQFQAFIDAPDGYNSPDWWHDLPGDRGPLHKPTVEVDNHPRDNVSWVQSVGFCRWLTVKLAGGLPVAQLTYEPEGVGRVTAFNSPQWVVRLPTHAEWKLAGYDNRPLLSYPWGNQFEERHANTRESGLERPVAVGMYPAGISVTGLYDVCGNVKEWTLTLAPDSASGKYSMWGGNFATDSNSARNYSQSTLKPDQTGKGVGFRPIISAPFEGRSYQPYPGVSRRVVKSRPA